MTKGIYPHSVGIDRALVSGLPDDHMVRFAPLPTFMSRPFGTGDKWLSLNSTYSSDMCERFNLISQKPDWVIDRLPGAEVQDAEIELRDSVAGYMLSTYPEAFRRRGNVIESFASGVKVNLDEADPMAACAALASEDLVLLLPGEVSLDGKSIYRVKSGALLFPNGWSLSSQFSQKEPPVRHVHKHAEWEEARKQSLKDARLGASMSEIHEGGEVHQYLNHYAPRVEHFFNAMKPGSFYWRRNWSPHTNNRLHNHSDMPDDYPDMTARFWRERGYLRVEQQTLNKLPVSGAIVFGIKTYHWPVRDIFNNPQAFEALVAANASLSPEMLKYRDHSLPSFRKALAAQEKKLGRKPTTPLNDL